MSCVTPDVLNNCSGLQSYCLAHGDTRLSRSSFETRGVFVLHVPRDSDSIFFEQAYKCRREHYTLTSTRAAVTELQLGVHCLLLKGRTSPSCRLMLSRALAVAG